jgi:tetratricopeptide (TPR) repeat protein
MIVLDARLAMLLATGPEWLRICSTSAEVHAFTGRYLLIGDRPYSLGREVGRGEEAIVFELIDLRSGFFDYVAKICRHPLDSDRFRQWATPIRFQQNQTAAQPDIELFPSRLLPLPDGGLIKIQRYMSPNPTTDWLSRLPIHALMPHLSSENQAEAIDILRSAVSTHGDRPLLLEFQGRLAASEDKLDEALELLTRALAGHIASGSSSRYATALAFAQVSDAIYRRDRSRGDVETSLTLDDGTVLRNTIFSLDTDAAALDDALQDRPVFALIEVMSDLPYFVAGLNFIQENLLDVSGGEAFRTVSDAVARIDPRNPLLAELADKGVWAPKTKYDETVTTESASRSPSTDNDAPTVIPPNVLEALQRHDAAYDPEPHSIRAGPARVAAAIADIRRGYEQDAEANLREAIALEPSVAPHRVALATYLFSRDRRAEAIDIIRESISAIPGAPTLRLLLGSMLVRTGQLDQAEDILRRARPLLPEYENDLDLLSAEVKQRRGGK